MATVGIIANPAAGKDIRRLVAHGRFVPDHEKVNVLRRVLAGLEAAGVERVVMMPDSSRLVAAASDGMDHALKIEPVEMSVFSAERDSSKAAELMAEMQVGCLVTLGGDGTNRAVAKGCGSVPIVAISTGTNNVFPTTVEGTVAGLAAGVVAMGLVDLHMVSTVTKILEVEIGQNLHDIALVDVAVSKERFVGARAIWDIGTIHELFLARTPPASIGLSAVGARLRPSATDDDTGLHIRLGPGGTSVAVPVAPGMVTSVPVQKWSQLQVGKPIEIDLSPCTIALDGERTLSLSPDQSARVALSDQGPRVVSVESAMRQATVAGVFTDGTPAIAE